jgi:hypothetical protein
MKIFVYEFLCGGGMIGQTPPAGLLAEGRAMWSAVVEDFARLPGVEVATTLDGRFHEPALAGVRIERVADETAERDAFLRLARGSDYTLVIAPETDATLQIRAQRVLDCGGKLLGPSPAAVAAAADKEALCGVMGTLTRAGVPTPWSRHRHVFEAARRAARSSAGTSVAGPAMQAALRTIEYPMPAVLKPRFGAGSQANFLVANKADWNKAAEQARREGVVGDLVFEPFVPGRAASVACLVGPAGIFPLTPGTQELSLDGRFRYLGGVMPLLAELTGRATELARRAVAAVPRLAGYVGVDLVLGDTPAGDTVIEINPRLTTSYVGLRAVYPQNLAGLMLQAVRGDPIDLPAPTGSVRFHPDGRVERQ